MLILRGQAAFSAFKLRRQLNELQCLSPGLEGLSAHEYFFVQLARPLEQAELHAVQMLLQAELDVGSEVGFLALVVPRLGTFSAWSAKAGEIAVNAGLSAVMRIERGIGYVLQGALGEAQDRLLAELYDPLTESLLLELHQAEQLFAHPEPAPLQTIALHHEGVDALERANRHLGLALSPEEIGYLAGWFRDLGRDPTDAELMQFAQSNSEHCRHKLFTSPWSLDGEVQRKAPMDLIRQTHARHGQQVISAYADNAAILKGGEAAPLQLESEGHHYRAEPGLWHSLLKVETHNHPTAISPRPGAATGSGGEIRDLGATGCGGVPRAGLTGFAVSNLNIPAALQPWEQPDHHSPRLASPLQIMLEAPLGAAGYNNEFGRPTVCGYFRTYQQDQEVAGQQRHYGYHKPIMLSGGLGRVRAEHCHKPRLHADMRLVVLGGPALEIGLGGGAASSVGAGCSDEALDFASVQRANPQLERRCQEVINRCIEAGTDNPIAFIHDVGAGGLANAFSELLHDGAVGGWIDLRAIPNADPGMSPLAIWCNEAQERYVLALEGRALQRFAAICARERCPWAEVGETTADGQIQVRDGLSANLSVDLGLARLLADSPAQVIAAHSLPFAKKRFKVRNIDLAEAAERVLKLPTVASKRFLISIADRSVGGLVCRDQMVGPWQVPVADCGVSAWDFSLIEGDALAVGERPPVALLDAPASGRLAVAEAITNIAAAAIDSIDQISLSANWMVGAGARGERAKLYHCVQAVTETLCRDLGICIPVGKDSVSMQANWDSDAGEQQVVAPLTLVATACAPVRDVRRTLTPQLRTSKGETCLILIDLGRGQNRLGASCLTQVYGRVGVHPADLDDPRDLVQFFRVIQKLRADNLLLAYHDRSDGGLFVSLVEMAFAGHVGLDIDLSGLVEEAGELVELLFSEELGAVVQVRECDCAKVLRCLEEHGLGDCSHRLGGLNFSDQLNFSFEDELVLSSSRVQLQRWWSETSFQLQQLRDNPDCAREEFDNLLDPNEPGQQIKVAFAYDADSAPRINTGARPEIAILREQGVNGHVEMAAAFMRAGFDPVDLTMSELLHKPERLQAFSGFAACGGFSYGDVLGAGSGWARTILLQPRLREQFAAFLEDPARFALGVCNGCQMLAQLSPLIPGSELWPHLTANRSEQFESRQVSVLIPESRSLFFRGMAGSILPVPVAHAEGQLDFSGPLGGQPLIDRQQVCLRYVDGYGQPTESYPHNPNGSEGGMTAFCNDDGRVTLMMPHPERAFMSAQLSWHPDSWPEHAPWLQLFANARAWLQ